MKKKRLFFSTEQTVTKKVSGYVEVDMGYAQVYEGIVRAFDKLNSVCALKLLPFLLFEMNDTNMVSFDRFLIKKFNKQFSDSFHERTIRNAMTELVKVGVVHKIQNGKYVIDARYCWIGDTVKRLDFIKNFESWKRDKLIGEADGIEIETSIDGEGSNLVEIALNKDKLI